MKKIFTTAIISCVCLSVALASGCNSKTYGFYTNIPENAFEVCDNHYKLGGIITGYSEEDRQFEEIDTAGYTSKSHSYYSMMAPAELVVSADFSADGAEVRFAEFSKAVSDILNDIDKSISASVSNSDISSFNSAEAGEELQITKITYDVLSEALRVYEFTDGYYNPALYYNVEAYCFGNKQIYPSNKSQLPYDEEIKAYTDLASHFGELELEERDGGYYVIKPEYTVEYLDNTLSMKLDLGGIGKGYAVDCVDRLFDEYGYKFGYFNFGASSMLVKSNVKEGNFNIYFASPRNVGSDEYGYVKINVRNEKLSTSGDNEKYYIIDGTRYCHVIDPTTGKPVQTGIMSVTVVGGSAAEDDALTTAIMAMGVDKAKSFIEEKLGNRKVIFTIDRD